MVKELINLFFDEIERKEFKKNKHAKATFWVEELQKVDYNNKNYIGIKKATRLYEKYVEGKETISVKEPNTFLLEEMSKYVGFENFKDYQSNFIKKNNKNKIQKNTGSSYKKAAFLVFCFVLVAFIIYKKNTSTCIIWKENRFEKASCKNPNALNNSTYNINIGIFSKVKATTETEFFKNNKPIIWYGKNSKKQMEFFTARGIHPETLKELKPITTTIINKYVVKK